MIRRPTVKIPAKQRGNSRLGRPQEIDDEWLLSRRDGFIDLFAFAWGRVGWELPRARSTHDVVAVFGGLDVHQRWSDLVAPFVRSTTIEATTTEVGRARDELNAAYARLGELERELRPLEERLRQADNAIALLPRDKKELPPDVKELRAAQRERARSLKLIKAKADEHMSEVRRRDTTFRDVEASAAQRELLAFIASQKYEFDPKNLANAVAGLPRIGWQRSHKRCSATKSGLWPHRSFEVFRLIEDASCDGVEDFTDALAQALRSLPTRNSFQIDFRQSLCKHWWFFKRAIADGFRANPESRPYQVFSLYQHYIAQPRSNQDLLRLSMEELDCTIDVKSR
jgi:hypothetical protein